jgi:branched-chain amino acid transport system substrate-binding protein
MQRSLLGLALGAVLVGTVAGGSACSSPNLDNTLFACTKDSDCRDGKVCAPSATGAKACVVGEVTDIHIGMSAAFSGTSGNLGTELRRGVAAAFGKVNASGGINNRRVVLDAVDDQYDPDLAAANVARLLDLTTSDPEVLRAKRTDLSTPDERAGQGVVALLGNVGTPTMMETFPIAVRNKALFFAPFTGAQKYLRDGTSSAYSFNFRAGYYDETRATVEWMFRLRTPVVKSFANILAFTQKDSYGDAGYAGLIAGYKSLTNVTPAPPTLTSDNDIFRVTYDRDVVDSVSASGGAIDRTIIQLCTLLGGTFSIESARICSEVDPQGPVLPLVMVMVDTYAPGTRFIKAVKDWIVADPVRAKRIDLTFTHVSFVGADSLARELVAAGTYTDPISKTTKSYAEGVYITQVVPSYESQSPGVVEYRSAIQALDQGATNWTSLEGYLATKLFFAGLAKAAGTDGDSLAKAFESLTDVDLGIGKKVGFSSTNHQASSNVWGTVLDGAGKFTVDYTWNPQDGIRTDR